MLSLFLLFILVSEYSVIRMTQLCLKPTLWSGESSSHSVIFYLSPSPSWRSPCWATRGAIRSPTLKTVLLERWNTLYLNYILCYCNNRCLPWKCKSFLISCFLCIKLMLDTWNESIFCNIKSRLQDSAMKLVHAERLGEAFDSQLVIGVRESYGKATVIPKHSVSVQMELSWWTLSSFCSLTVNLCSNTDDKLQIYRENFEKSYLDSTERFYKTQAPSYLQQNGVQNYMKYVSVFSNSALKKFAIISFLFLIHSKKNNFFD